MRKLRREPSRLYRFTFRLVKVAAILTGLFAVWLTSAHIAMQLAMERDRVEVPRVVGVDSVAAGQLIREVGLTPQVVAEEFSDKIPKGRVTTQRPIGSTRAKNGSVVRLFLSRGTDQLEVPNLAGITLVQAQRSLAEAGLALGPVTAIHSDAHARETIIAQDPPAGASATRGATMRLLQSLGPWEEMVTMPDLRGREMVTAINLLREIQVAARVSFERSVSREGQVVAQDPPPGAQVKVGGQVMITVGD
ncbi:MAG: PASTA domain-containing protein [Candidatus Methylomirabilales bacterium]